MQHGLDIRVIGDVGPNLLRVRGAGCQECLRELVASVPIAGYTPINPDTSMNPHTYMAAVLAQDLRGRLPSIAAPVLLVVPSYGPDLTQQGITAAEKLAYYRELMTGTRRLEVAPLDNARHFAMIDQPRAFNEALRQFLKTL